MLLLSWIAQGGGRGIITLDLLNCTEVRSVASLTHPSAQDEVGMIAATAQTANAQAEGFGDDGVDSERLGAESARGSVRWVSAIWEVLDRPVTVPDRSETQSPTGSMRTIRLMISSLFRDLGSLSRQPSLRSHAADNAVIFNQTIVYPGDPRVIAPSRSSSLWRTTSMTEFGEEFESALRWAKDARPGLGFGLGHQEKIHLLENGLKVLKMAF
ncbi:hypothetical protein BGY98DRAFT_1098756 [Russula aff. rugulosa BPL654]|nr:hypothetical protein BGY98DRAFT_1098756 [Russula aff. rugulosa BPL654]